MSTLELEGKEAELKMLKGDIEMFGPAGDDLQRVAKLVQEIADLKKAL